ncbi:diacylglycerol kinase gamma-like isoform X2 [Limulus polyphemus]|uniref:Diacylglycerol kinase gamma-like isoform X2 n=1 Tax=Limulus polyphemus TaxID=6850 RepID=A0ABM1SXK8_LIMPO|nr:diacylglycerol kinase gamma-like isoform X2 [Limulus polyphemus]
MFSSCWCSSGRQIMPKKICYRHSTNGIPLSHTFKTKVFKRDRSCDFCRQTINREQGSCCRVCKYTCHKECEVRYHHGVAVHVFTTSCSVV